MGTATEMHRRTLLPELIESFGERRLLVYSSAVAFRERVEGNPQGR